jgi:hypothetical protein
MVTNFTLFASTLFPSVWGYVAGAKSGEKASNLSHFQSQVQFIIGRNQSNAG